MNCDLERLFGKLARSIPTSIHQSFVFSSAALPTPPAQLATERLYVQKGWHDYESRFRADALWLHAHKRTYRELALLILAVVFHPEPIRVQLELTHPASDIKLLLIQLEHDTSVSYGDYKTLPHHFEYFPQKTERHPWVGLPIDPLDLPCFWLTNKEENIGGTQEDWNNRETIIGFGNDRASIMLAQFLLDASRPQNKLNEYEFEGDAGWRNLGRWSAEARLWLPGSAAWNPHEW